MMAPAESLTMGLGDSPRRVWNGFTAALSALLGIAMFVASAVTTIPQAFSVISFIATERGWYIVVELVANALMAGGMFWLKKVDADLASGQEFRKRTQ